MRNCFIGLGAVYILAIFASAQQPPHTQLELGKPASSTPAAQALKKVLEPKVKTEWEALKNKDKKTFASLLTDDFEAVEDDGDGARNRIHATNEVEHSNIHDYSMAFFNPVPLSPDAAFVTYEVTMVFPPKATMRYKRIYITEIWVKQGQEWKLRHYQETRVK
ncbi:MAG TPA: nuclear transport factor 2 family protein [Terriglobales bacterium]|nr:nuclear transport factor 2 family protein [Terriglobales bacterium]